MPTLVIVVGNGNLPRRIKPCGGSVPGPGLWIAPVWSGGECPQSASYSQLTVPESDVSSTTSSSFQ